MLGYMCAEGHDPSRARAQPELAIRLAKPAAVAAAKSSSKKRADATWRSDVSILMGGCGDARLFSATLIDAANAAKGKSLRGTRLRVVLNDHRPEVIARAFVLLHFLQLASNALPARAPLLPHVADLPPSAVAAINAFWHVYFSPSLHGPAYDDLLELFSAAADAPGPELPWVQCTPGTWAKCQQVLRGWCSFDMTNEELRQIAKDTKRQQDNYKGTDTDIIQV